MILYGLASYCKNELIKRIYDSIYKSVIQKCQMDVSIRYQDSTKHKFKTRYFDSQYLERPNADNFLDSINVSTAKLAQDSFLHLAVDGPNVNWDVLNTLDNKLVEDGFSKTLNIGSCTQHVVHGAFQTGSSNTGLNLEKILKGMFYLFQDSPAQGETFQTVSGTDIFPLRQY